MKQSDQTEVEQQVSQLHHHYCKLTGQNLSLRYDRQRAWYELLRSGYTRKDVEQVVRYLQREIRAERRRIGALKLSNLLQPDRFEEDLNISRAKLMPRKPTASHKTPPEPTDNFSAEEGAQAFRNLRLQLMRNAADQSENHTAQSDAATS